MICIFVIVMISGVEMAANLESMMEWDINKIKQLQYKLILILVKFYGKQINKLDIKQLHHILKIKK